MDRPVRPVLPLYLSLSFSFPYYDDQTETHVAMSVSFCNETLGGCLPAVRNFPILCTKDSPRSLSSGTVQRRCSSLTTDDPRKMRGEGSTRSSWVFRAMDVAGFSTKLSSCHCWMGGNFLWHRMHRWARKSSMGVGGGWIRPPLWVVFFWRQS